MEQKTLFLMLGYPGAGKTTAAKLIKDITGSNYLSSDELRERMFEHSNFSQAEHDELYKALDGQLEQVMKTGKSIIYDANLNRIIHRQEKYELAKKYDYSLVLIWVQAPKDVARQRRVVDAAHHHLVPAHETPEQMFERSVGVFEEPSENEPHITIDGTRIDKNYIEEKLRAAGAI